MAPAALVVLVVYVGCVLWSVWISMTNSRILPNTNFIGLRQYESLFSNSRWDISVVNLALFGLFFLVIAIALGFLLAILIDQRVRCESLFRSIFLYAYSMSFIVTGLVWHWLLNPTLGVQQLVRNQGFENFKFDWIVDQDRVIYTVVAAAVWHGSGFEHGQHNRYIGAPGRDAVNTRGRPDVFIETS